MSEVLSKKDYEKVKAIIDFIDEYGEISPKEVENITKKSAATVRRYLKMLVDTERIVAEGSIKAEIPLKQIWMLSEGE